METPDKTDAGAPLWDEGLTPLLVQLVLRGLDGGRVAAVIGCQPAAIEERLYGGPERLPADLSEEESAWLRSRYRKTPYAEMQRKLGVSLASLMLIAICMGLRKCSEGRWWSQEEVAALKRLRAQGMEVRECAALMGRASRSVEHKLYDKKENFISAQEPGRKLDGEQLEWFIRHYRDTSNADIQRRFGISFGYLHTLAQAHGLTKSASFMRRKQEAAQEAAAESHRANGTYPPKGYRIPGSEGRGFQKGVNNEMRLGKARNRKRIEKAAKSLAVRRRREKLLASCGLPQKTKLRVVAMTSSKLSYCHNLRKYGYTQDERDKNLWYYPADGSRRLRLEKNGERHGIRFRPKSEMHFGTPDPDKVPSDKLRFTNVETVFADGPVNRRCKPDIKKTLADEKDIYFVSNRIVENLGAYANRRSVLYSED